MNHLALTFVDAALQTLRSVVSIPKLASFDELLWMVESGIDYILTVHLVILITFYLILTTLTILFFIAPIGSSVLVRLYRYRYKQSISDNLNFKNNIH